MATHSSVLAWRIPGTGEPGGLPSTGLHRVGHDWSDLAAAFPISNHVDSTIHTCLLFLTCSPPPLMKIVYYCQALPTTAVYHISPRWLQSLPNPSPCLHFCPLLHTTVPQHKPPKTQIWAHHPVLKIIPQFPLAYKLQTLGLKEPTLPPLLHTPTHLSHTRTCIKISGQCKMWLSISRKCGISR